jgi:hypothetical protein
LHFGRWPETATLRLSDETKLCRFPAKEVQDDHHQCDHEDKVNETTGDVHREAENPAEDENDSDDGEHVID